MRFPKDVFLPSLPLDVTLDSYDGRLRKRLIEVFADVRKVTMGIQSPPVMHLRLTGNQALTGGVAAKIQLDSTRYDTHGYWDATNYRWFPKLSGYYRISWSIAFSAGASANNNCIAALYINGSADRAGQVVNPVNTGQITANNSTLIYLDGSTSYIELWALTSQSCNALGDQTYTYLTANFAGENAIG